MSKHNRYGIVSWCRDILRMRKQVKGNYVQKRVLEPTQSPLDMAYYQGYVQGWNEHTESVEQLRLFDFKLGD